MEESINPKKRTLEEENLEENKSKHLKSSEVISIPHTTTNEAEETRNLNVEKTSIPEEKNLPVSFNSNDLIQLLVVPQQIEKEPPIRLIVVNAGFTLFNLHRVFMIAFKYKDNLAIEHNFIHKSGKYGSGPGKRSGRMSDRTVKLNDLFRDMNDELIYQYGQLECQISIDTCKFGCNSSIRSWVPRCVEGSQGNFPPENKCNDKAAILKHKVSSSFDINKINKKLMFERFGVNQTQNARKRQGPSVLCFGEVDPTEIVLNHYRKPLKEEDYF